MYRHPLRSTLFPYTTLFRSERGIDGRAQRQILDQLPEFAAQWFRRFFSQHLQAAMDVVSGRCRSEEHTSELQSRFDLVCRLLLEKKKFNKSNSYITYYELYS